PLIMIFRPAVFDSNALAFDKTCLLQSLSKPAQVVRGDIGRLGVEQPDHGPPRLLPARCYRPCRRAAEQSDELAPPDHSITSSARASSVGGTVRPIAFAALRLMTSSYFTGACTGRSPGFSPLRMRSTYVAERRNMSRASGP